ncbi:hypothetical protein FQZ97_642820 [compost metagenome]
MVSSGLSSWAASSSAWAAVLVACFSFWSSLAPAMRIWSSRSSRDWRPASMALPECSTYFMSPCCGR